MTNKKHAIAEENKNDCFFIVMHCDRRLLDESSWKKAMRKAWHY